MVVNVEMGTENENCEPEGSRNKVYCSFGKAPAVEEGAIDDFSMLNLEAPRFPPKTAANDHCRC